MHTKSRWLLSSLLFIVVILQAAASGEPLRLPKIFGDHMVLQRDLPVVIWGRADAGEEVTVEFAGQTRSSRADGEGRWRVKLAPLEAATNGARLTARAEDEAVAFEDVLVGEVWLCSGQSNMEWTVANSNDAEAEIAKANHPTIRHVKIERVMLAEPVDDVESAEGWQHCTADNVGSFTAVGYFFGLELSKKLNVPIGLINSSWGGSNIEAFTSLEGFRQVPELKDIVDRIESSLPGHPSYEKAVGETMAKTQQWLSEAGQALAEDRRVPAAPTLPDNAKPLLNWVDPANKHNAMIHGLAPYRIRGSIWYQGESNHNDGMLYVKKTQALVAGWRRAWNQPDLPHYYVQIAPFQYGNEDPTILPKFWEAQAAIEKEIPHTGMVVIHDVGNIKDIHPRNKQAVGHRLAVLALAETYGRDVVAGGPRFEKMTVEGDKVRVFFNRTGAGLVTSDGKEPDFFEIAGQNGMFVPAKARIDGPTVVLSAPDVRKPCAIRYAWSKLAEP
ncbi:MAG: sialate O-acetylesterase, partial [Planctomycetota bacterium]